MFRVYHRVSSTQKLVDTQTRERWFGVSIFALYQVSTPVYVAYYVYSIFHFIKGDM